MKRVLITGASGGIGQELSLLLAERGFSLVLTGRNKEALISLQDKLAKKSHVEYLVCDLSKVEERIKLERFIENNSFDLIINNAGFGLYGEAIALDLAEQLAMVDVNVKALLSLSVVGARAMIRDSLKGMIVNISSAASFLPTPNMSVYGATKAFVTSFSEALDYELRPKGVRVLTSCPGMVATDFSKRASKKSQLPRIKYSMSVSQAAKEILWQITYERALHIFDQKTKWGIRIAKLLPSSWQQRVVYKSIQKRIKNEV